MHWKRDLKVHHGHPCRSRSFGRVCGRIPVVVQPMRAVSSLAVAALLLLGILASLPVADSATLGACSTDTVPNPRPASWYALGKPAAMFGDDCFHQFMTNAPDSPTVDIVIAAPAGPMPLRDVSLLRQSAAMWGKGIADMARATGREWLADGLRLNTFVLGVDTAEPGYAAAVYDPEVLILTTDALAVGYAGIGTDAPIDFCHGVPYPVPTSSQVAALPGFDDHHGQGVGTYSAGCGDTGGRVCVVANNAFLFLPDDGVGRDFYDLNSHELGHCLGTGHVGDASDFAAKAYPRDDIMSYQNDGWDPAYALCVSNLDVKTLAYVYQPLVPGAPAREPGHLGGYITMEGGRDPWAPGPSSTSWRAIRPDGAQSTTAAQCGQPDYDLLALPLASDGGPSPEPQEPSLEITAPADGTTYDQAPNLNFTVSGTYDCADECAPSPLTGSTHVYQGGAVDPFVFAPDQTTMVAGTPVSLSGRGIKSGDAAYPLAAGMPARVTLYDAAGEPAFSFAAPPLEADVPTGVDSDPNDFATSADWTSDPTFPPGDYRLAIEVGGFAQPNLWWGIPSIPVRVVGPGPVPSAAATTGPLPPFLFEPQADSAMGPPAPWAAVLDGPFAQPHRSSWRDPAAGGNGDYLFIDSPADGSAVDGVTALSGRAGNSPTDPGCAPNCGGGGGNGTSGEDFSDDSQVVIAVIDTGGNPYHSEFRDETRLQHPSRYLTGFPAGADGVRLCFANEASGSFSYNDDCPSTWAAARAADAAEWASVAPGELVWFPGTRMMGISFAHDGQAGYNVLDGTRDLGDSGDTHGSWTTSTAAGKTAGTCPQCLVVIIEADSVEAIDQGYAWAAGQPWIDVITSSVGYGLIGLGWNPGPLGNGMTPGAKEAVQNGKLFFEAAGNGLANFGLVPTSTWLLQSSNPFTVAVGSSNEATGEASFYYDLPVDVLGTGQSRHAAQPGSLGAFQSVTGTSFASPSAAGTAAAALLAARAAVGDAAEGASAAGASKTLLRNADGVAVPQGPFANGVLTLDEFREAVLKNAEPAPLVFQGSHAVVPAAWPDSPASFVWEGYGELNAGYDGSAADHSGSTRSAEIAATLLGTRPMPSRPEAQAWTDAIQAINEQWWGEARPAMDGDSDDGFPRTDYLACPDCSIPDEASVLLQDVRAADSLAAVGDALAAHGLLSGLAPGAPVPAPSAPRAMGTEADPEAEDPSGDGILPGSDVGNVWVSGDDGASLDVNLRLNEDHLPSAFVVERTTYGVDFTLERTGVQYGLRALDDVVEGGWSFSLQVPSQDGAFTCELPDHDLSGSQADGTLVTWHVDYSDLDVVTKPTTTGTTCNPAGLGGPAQKGDQLTGLSGLTSHVIGIVDFGGSFGDSTDSAGSYTLGGSGSGGGGGSTCAQVCLIVNGQRLANATLAADGTWSADVDFSAFTPPYSVYAWHGTANATATYVAPGGGDGDPTVSLSADRTQVVPGGTVTFTVNARHAATASNQAPTASFTAAVNGLDAYFNGTTSSDPDGDALSYAWDFGDGATATGTTPGALHSYADPGTFTVTLTVSDGRGGSDTASQDVAVQSQGPTGAHTILALTDAEADASPLGDVKAVTAVIDPSRATLWVNATFVGTTPAPLGNQARGNGLVVGEWYFNGVNYEAFTDGTVWNYATSAPEPGMDYVAAGDQIRLTVTDASAVYGAVAGGGVEFSFGSNLGSVAVFGLVVDDAVPDAGTAPLQDSAVALVAGGASASGPCVPAPCLSGSGDESVVVQVDGETVHVEGFSRLDEGASGYTFEYAHAFSGNGTHEVSVLFRDDQNLTVRGGPLTVTVTAAANDPPTASAGPDQDVEEGAFVELAGSGTDSDGSVASYFWQQVTGPQVVLSSKTNATVRFTAPAVESTAILAFRLTVTDDDGATASDVVDVTVRPEVHAPNVIEATIHGHRARTPLPPTGGEWSIQLTGLGDLPAGDRVLTVTAYGSDGQPIATDNVTIHVRYTPRDSDGDGYLDPEDNCGDEYNPGQEDLDGDGPGDACDADLDGDGTANHLDAFPYDPAEWADTDGDGVGDNRDAFPADPSEWQDSDGDGRGDNADRCPGSSDKLDADGDGIPDGCDQCPTVVGGCEADSDGDNVSNAADNCVDHANPDQRDLDGDRRGDVCDNDRDGDGFANGQERAFGTNPDDPASHP